MKWVQQHIELIAWSISLLFPFFIDPAVKHFSFCFFHLAGLEWCPGCGLGRSIAWLYRGEWSLSFQTHWFGFAAVILLLYRIIVLLKLPGKQITKPTII